MTVVKALLANPSSKSLGVTALASEHEGRVIVTGLARPSAHRGEALDSVLLAQLLDGGHALAANIETPGPLPPSAVALWVGTEFSRSADGAGVGLPPLPKGNHRTDGGTFYLGPAADLVPYLERWTRRAFREFAMESRAARRGEIASLMTWAMPNAPETLAAAWQVAPTPEQELRIQTRTFAHGVPAERLRAQHEGRLTAAREHSTPPRIVVFAGGTGTGREDVAKRFAHVARSSLLNFKRGLPTDKVAAAEAGQAAVERSPLAMTISAVGEEIAPKQDLIVLDGLRHVSILRSLEWLLQPAKLLIVSVDADEEAKKEYCRQRHYDFNLLASHPTETEVRELSTNAAVRLGPAATESQLRSLLNEAMA